MNKHRLGDANAIANPERAMKTVVETVESQGGGEHFGRGTGVAPASFAVSDALRAAAANYSPEHQAELERDRLATEALVRECVSAGTFAPTGPFPRNGRVDTGVASPPPQAPAPLPGWTPPPVGGRK